VKPDACGIIQSGLAVILDMDGVIIHSNPVHRVAWERFNARYGLATSEAMHERMYGKRNDEIIRDFYGDLGEEEIRRRGAAKEELYRSLVAGGLERHLVPGVRKFLQKLGNTPVGLGTNAERANVDFLLDGAEIRRFFFAPWWTAGRWRRLSLRPRSICGWRNGWEWTRATASCSRILTPE